MITFSMVFKEEKENPKGGGELPFRKMGDTTNSNIPSTQILKRPQFRMRRPPVDRLFCSQLALR